MSLQEASDEFSRRVAVRIRLRREMKGMTKFGLAQAAGLDPRAITFIEEFRRTPSIGTVYRISYALGCTMSELMDEAEGGEGGRQRDGGTGR